MSTWEITFLGPCILKYYFVYVFAQYFCWYVNGGSLGVNNRIKLLLRLVYWKDSGGYRSLQEVWKQAGQQTRTKSNSEISDFLVFYCCDISFNYSELLFLYFKILVNITLMTFFFFLSSSSISLMLIFFFWASIRLSSFLNNIFTMIALGFWERWETIHFKKTLANCYVQKVFRAKKGLRSMSQRYGEIDW